MKAIRPSEPGGPEVLTLEEHAEPVPGPDQVLVRTSAIGVNYIDVYHRTALYSTPRPIPLGLEGAGVVEAIGSGVSQLRVGARVAWCQAPGSYATRVLVPTARAVEIPDGIDDRVAAALLLQGMTAHYLCTDTFPLGSGHTALVHAAAGGVGLLLVQLAKRAGARVFGTVSTPEKAELARSAGADAVIFYREQDFESEVRRLTNGQGVDVVYDSVGKATVDKSLRSLRPRGYLVLFGQSSGMVSPMDPQVLSAGGSLFLTRPTLAHYTRDRAELMGRANALFRAVSDGTLQVRIGGTFPLAEARRAHEALEGRETTGKILLIP
ncbi:MAG TPA: quinone oxidoreductase [Polyangiaceae bacterium]|nr:quinone oxidoreductase [Polyangiaceae bacterium]